MYYKYYSYHPFPTMIYYSGLKILWLHSPGQPNLEQMTLTFYFADGGSGSLRPMQQNSMGSDKPAKHGDMNYVKHKPYNHYNTG